MTVPSYTGYIQGIYTRVGTFLRAKKPEELMSVEHYMVDGRVFGSFIKLFMAIEQGFDWLRDFIDSLWLSSQGLGCNLSVCSARIT